MNEPRIDHDLDVDLFGASSRDTFDGDDAVEDGLVDTFLATFLLVVIFGFAGGCSYHS